MVGALNLIVTFWSRIQKVETRDAESHSFVFVVFKDKVFENKTKQNNTTAKKKKLSYSIILLDPEL